jgi:hypothetical protein
MERMSHADQHRDYPAGTEVIALNGALLGTVREVYPHFLLVTQAGDDHLDLEVPPHAIARYDGERLYLTVNREALSAVDDDVTAERRLHPEGD